MVNSSGIGDNTRPRSVDSSERKIETTVEDGREQNPIGR